MGGNGRPWAHERHARADGAAPGRDDGHARVAQRTGGEGLATPSPALSTGPAATPRRKCASARHRTSKEARKAESAAIDGDRARGSEPSGWWLARPESAHTTRTPPEARQRCCRAVTMAWRARAAVGRGDDKRDGESQPPRRGRGGRQLEGRGAYPLSRARSLCFFYLSVTPPPIARGRGRMSASHRRVRASRNRCRQSLAMSVFRHDLHDCAALSLCERRFSTLRRHCV
jgi:hypothetical protein